MEYFPTHLPPPPSWLEALASWATHDGTVRTVFQDDPTTAEKVLDGLARLRKHLPDGWLARAVALRVPFVWHFGERTPWVWHWLSKIGHDIERAAALPGFDRLRPLWTDPHGCAGAVAQVQMAARMACWGPQVVLEPDVPNGQADLLVRDLDLYVEIKTLEHSERHRVEEERTLRIAHRAIPPLEGVFAGGWFRTPLSAEEFEFLRAKMDTAIEDAKSMSVVTRIQREDLCDMVLYPPSAERQIPPAMRGLRFGARRDPALELRRLRAEVWRSAKKQLPTGHMGVVVLHPRGTLPVQVLRSEWPSNTEFVRALAHWPNVSAVIVSEYEVGPLVPKKARVRGSTQFRRAVCAGDLWERGVVLQNRAAERPLNSEALELLTESTPE